MPDSLPVLFFSASISRASSISLRVELHYLDDWLINIRVHYAECLVPASLKVKTHSILGIEALLVREPGVIS